MDAINFRNQQQKSATMTSPLLEASTGNDNYWLHETISLLTFSLMKGLGYRTIRNLSLRAESLKQVLKVDSSDEFVDYLKQAGCKTANQLGDIRETSVQDLWKEATNLYRQLNSQGITVIHSGQADFPQRLRGIKEPPRWLFVQGNVSVLHQNAIAIVGTRTPSEDGQFLAQYIGGCLPYFKQTVTVSGLANGIDQIVHRSSIRFKVPTIAVLGTGILVNYPENSGELRQEICKAGGAVISEYLPLESYGREKFVFRNRLQAGLARALIPVEWKAESGTAHTVRFAREANRKIICLKLPDWSDSRAELIKAQNMGADIFTVPGQETALLDAIKQCLNLENNTEDDNPLPPSSKRSKKQPEYHQLTLWDREV
jgi:DNA processing protein